MDIVMKRTNGQEIGEERRVVRVLPTRDDIRKHIKHPISKVGFLAEGSVEWPLDQFTRRRIADGDVTIERSEAKAIEQKKSPPSEPPKTS
jgi:hypothetical protein